LKAGRRTVVLADHSKFRTQGLIAYGSFREVDVVVTSNLVDAEDIESLRSKGVEVIVGSVREDEVEGRFS
jgi:DeoR family fructose operon transcriptional repressor